MSIARDSKNVLLLVAFGIVTVFSSCRKELPVVYNAQSYPGDNYTDLFDAFWNGMNSKYVYWSLDTTNWDDAYKKYRPLFEKLTTFDAINESAAEGYFEEMTKGLIDSHFNLTFESSGNTFNPSTSNRYLQNPSYFSDSIFPRESLNQLICSKYIDSSSLITGTDFIPGGITFDAITGTIRGKILYLYLSSFSISNAGPNTSPVFNSFFNVINNLPSYIKGIVIDLRGNFGGEVTDLDYLVGQMVNSEFTFGYTRAKNGVGRLDYTPWAPAVVKPWNGGVNIKIPIIVLGDHASKSMAEITTMAIKTLPNGKFIGTRTWGATGPVSSEVYYNGGQFSIGVPYWGANGYMSIFTSSAMFKYLNGDIYEGVGIPPDIYAIETNVAYNNNHDLVIDAAINYISTN
jgi:carboxyl-terminal processing protease